MPMASRAAQFAPFAALSGHDDAIAETIRQTENFKELSEEEKNLISRKLNFALENHSRISLTYYIPDRIKSGGSYKRIIGRIKNVDESDNAIVFRNGQVIPVHFISGIDLLD